MKLNLNLRLEKSLYTQTLCIQLVIILVLLFFTEQIYAQNASLKKGLIAYYPFNGNAEDASGNKNHGRQVAGVSLTKDRFGHPCSAMYFNGSDGYISVQSSQTLKSPVSGISVAGWFKLAQDSPFADLKWVSMCCKSNRDIEDDNNPQYRFQTTSVTFSISTDFTENWTQNLKYNHWYFYAMTYNGRSVKVYLDAEKVMDFPYTRDFVPNDLPLEIGRDVPGVLEYFAGVLDDIRIYNRPLSETDIIALYKDDTEKDKTVFPCPGQIVTAPPPPVSNVPNQTQNGNNIRVQHEVEVRSKKITVYLYDHEKQDGDIISVIFDGEVVLDKYKLKSRKDRLKSNKSLELTLEPNKDYYLVSKAWNLGKIPPNTLTLEIYDWVNPKPQIVTINSKIGRSGAIRLRYRP